MVKTREYTHGFHNSVPSLHFEDIIHYQKLNESASAEWKDGTEKIRNACERLGTSEVARTVFADAVTQYESEVVYLRRGLILWIKIG